MTLCVSEYESALWNTDGVLGQMLTNSDGVVTSFAHRNGGTEDLKNLYLSIARIANFLPEEEDVIDVRLDSKKILCIRWRYHIFVLEVMTAHPVNKSIRRTIRRMQRKYDKPAVQSLSWNGSRPAASSSDPTTEASSPSLEVARPPTGDCLADLSSPESPSSKEPSENSEKKPEFDLPPDLS